MRRPSSLAFIVVLVACALAPSSVRAEDVDKQVQKMNKRAMDDYDSLEFESSRRTLLDAVQMLRANGIDETPLAAKTYANLGIVYINGFKDRNRGQQQFVNALKIAPDYKLDPAVATPELDEAFQAAGKQVAKLSSRAKTPKPLTPPPTPPKPVTPPPTEKPPETPPTTPPQPPTTPGEEVHGLQHTPVDESRPNTPIPVRGKLGADVGATRVFLFFRGSGQEDFLSVPMKNSGGNEWVGVIPGDAVTGKSIQYYLEARDARGRAVVNAGSGPSPFVVVISDTAAAPSNVPEVDVEDPLMKERLARKRKEEEHKSTRDHLFIFVMPGFGFGVEPAGNHTEVAWQFQTQGANAMKFIQQPVGSTGIAVAPFHLAVELGYLITPKLSLSLFGRFQLVTGANAETVQTGSTSGATTKAFGAVAVLVRARYRFLEGRFHPYIHVDLGGGEIRHVLDISSAESDEHPLVDKYTADTWNANPSDPATLKTYQQEVCANHKTCSDTISLGYLFLGGGAGIWYDFAAHFAFIL
ncbi:MAG TPA: hypothetical protein VHB97_14360, partial [Polyangia bacterium]|nr:hypothetical protein [Polyangia bacterium]